ncbi:hypothetical protein FRC02_006338 [Tulasnella sp. 418]|nr:hypothetical protein FRC02_006338 [Tulasnella sp. 418]
MSGLRGQMDDFSEEDEEFEYEYESTLIAFDLEGVDPILLPNSQSMKVMGLDTSFPHLQLPSATLRGTPQSLIGTELLFKHGKDQQDRARRFVVPLGSTSKRIRFRNVDTFNLKHSEKATLLTSSSDNIPPPVLFAGRKKTRPKSKFAESSNIESNDQAIHDPDVGTHEGDKIVLSKEDGIKIHVQTASQGTSPEGMDQDEEDKPSGW